ncbi:hypothetical protein [Roseivirga pacifica]|uniref:hypothetical protein n=1 Tax=Roseivirga pacifica TaxID=1267423 RepID=UPI00227BED29|nr:hypothetical protein [Roseivirga pacifica]
MKIYGLILFLLLIQPLTSCSEKKTASNSDITAVKNAEFITLDSIDLSNNFGVYHTLISYAKGFERNNILTTELPNLKIHRIDSSGQYLNTISKRGEAPGHLGSARFAVSYVGKSGRIYIVTTGNAYELYVFENNGTYIGSIPLFKHLQDQFAVFKSKSAMHVYEYGTNNIRLTLSSESTIHLTNSAEFYENSDALAVFDIDVESLALIDAKTEIPYKSIDEVQKALATKKFNWSSPSPNIDFYNQHYYLSFPFFNGFFIYDLEFNLIEKIDFGSDKNLGGFYAEMDGQKSQDKLINTIQLFRLLRENINVSNIQVEDSLVLIQYPEVFKKGTYPLPNRESIGNVTALNYAFEQVFFVYDLKTKQLYNGTLPEEHYNIMLLDRNTMLIETQSSQVEDKILLKAKLKL